MKTLIVIFSQSQCEPNELLLFLQGFDILETKSGLQMLHSAFTKACSLTVGCRVNRLPLVTCHLIVGYCICL